MVRKAVTMKSLLFCVAQVVVFTSLALVSDAQGCATGVCVQKKYCPDSMLKVTKSEKCQMQSKAAGVCCDVSRITLGKNCVFPFKKQKLPGKCVPASSCAPHKGKYIWKTLNKDCSDGRSKNFYCCPGNLIRELDASKLGSVEYEKPKVIPVVEQTGVTESPTLVQNAFPTCQTSARQNGHCVPLQLCDRLNKVPKKNRDNFVKKNKCPSKAVGGSSICCPNPANSTSFILHQKAAKLGFDKCGSIPMGDKVLAGEKAGLGQYPWMANLMYKVNDTHLEPRCGGSLIHPRYVLTAAHCKHQRWNITPVAVRLGEYDLSKMKDCEDNECAEPFKEYSIEGFFYHDKYRLRKRDHDIALIRLKTKVTLMPGQIVPICLPLTASLMMLKPKQLTVTGWGLTETGKASDVLLKANLVHLESDFDDCNKESTFCARGSEMQGSCQGDSGGPLQTIVPVGNTYRTVLFGIVSGGAIKCSVKVDTPGVVVSVGYHMQWILDNIKI